MPEELDEINLWDYWMVIRKRAGIIMTIFGAAVIASAVLSFFVLPPVYEATVAIMVQDPGGEGTPQWSLETYSSVMEGSAVRRAVVETLKLDETPEDLKEIASTEILKGTNILRLKVKRNSAQEASEIANTWARLFVAKVNEIKMNDLSRAINLRKAALEAALAEIKDQRPTIELKRSLVDEPMAYEAVKSLVGNQARRLAAIQVNVEEPNPTYQDLISRIADSRLALKDLETRLELLKTDSQVFVRVLSPSLPPESPVAPRKLLNIAVAAMLGLMVGVFLAFAMEALEAGANSHSPGAKAGASQPVS
ncbi:MAG TPA: hypothetical protein GX506_02205 [Firmicutes bacterium]|nr:hypothetical protein [Bacillota bacterium]